MIRAIRVITTALGGVLVATVALGFATARAEVPAHTPRVESANIADATASSGFATHYDFGPGGGGTNGNCSFPALPKDDLYVAVGPDKYRHGAGCGTFLDVTGPKAKVRVAVMDQCHECGPGHLDLSDAAFRRIGNYNSGKIPVRFKLVKNPTVPPLALRFKEGSSAYWAALQVINNGNAIRSVTISGHGRSLSMTRTEYGYWLAPRGAGNGPYLVQVRDVLGHRVALHNVPLKPGKVQPTKSRLYG
ncbi:expansin EXLX1 family cellulose-binding protein [Curtobacterium flaccumfaciens]|uniref:expansin EXLX1 family cellulose-binding protein n=1 Tax=Curtobacterium flaccumfaciens TaxID=2035 RepID=UPI001BDF7098|nr:expansin EXLX1 family cellulose-binding protein [Curtobacterium flaccumfaciens]MBT1608008.1 hypothetical protein [Curtobacterium flaccumfaciens pv. betae]MBT1658517.1 hypothetical protein [Curtobacterium flaccumfaciens pv. betae]MCS0472866.1 hypothetical protein [Curtobacterium flaccumfaciens pv. betae]MCS0476235.1 hypothetical protein [Curtobacterium flaccumfaciens pv. betae]MCS0479716.1 hypothetical protein [Curtobacterium flaccumfaciens pv. betae]